MDRHRKLVLVFVLLVSACAPSEGQSGSDLECVPGASGDQTCTDELGQGFSCTPQGVCETEPDAGAEQQNTECSGDVPILKLSGSAEGTFQPFVYVTTSDRITSFTAPLDSLYFGTAHSILEPGDVHDIGTYDVSQPTHQWRFTDYEAGDPLCETSPCDGFYAMAGSFEVTAHQTLYRATFEFSDLRELGADGPGAIMAGSVSGCLIIEAP